jgi:hypothetical protein
LRLVNRQSRGPDPDTTPPVATIDSGPADGETVIDTNSTSVTFKFAANEPSTFECRLKTPSSSNLAFTSCESESSQTYNGLTDEEFAETIGPSFFEGVPPP